MSSPGLQQVQSQTQSLILAPQLRQSLKILQVPTLDLRATILSELETNPILEELPMEGISLDAPETNQENSEEEDLQIEEDNFEIFSKLDEDWREYFAQENAQYTNNSALDENRKHFFDSIVGETSLQEHLVRQASLLDLDPLQFQALEYLIGSLNDHGFLTVSNLEIEQVTHLPAKDIEIARLALQSLDPPGIGAADLQECLLIQLKQAGRENSLAWQIVQNHFALLLRRRIPDLSRKVGSPLESVEEALEVISELDPSPGKKFSEDLNRIVVPDVKVELNDHGQWQVILNHEFIPRLRLSQHYKEMIASGKLNSHEKDYLREKIRSGRFLIHSIEQRLQTIEKITWQIIHFQKEFFEKGSPALKPLTMNQVAQEIGIHETTVSRAISNKYIETPHGVFDMKYFFTSGYQSESGESISNTSIKGLIHQMIQSEDPSKPLSDQEIARRLEEENITIARRTVAKYREELNILPTHLRRRYR